MPAINAAAAALCISDIPFQGPLGCVRIAYDQDGEWISHPTYEEGEQATFEMVVAGRLLEDGDVAVMMVEAGGTENSWKYFEAGAPKVDEKVLAEGLEFSKGPIKDAIALQQELVKSVGESETMEFTVAVDYSSEIMDAVEEVGSEKIADSQKIADKAARGEAESQASAEILETLEARFSEVENATTQIKSAIRSLTKSLVRKRIVEEGLRIDGRTPTDLRSLSSEVGILPTAHGSGLFQRGETQVLNITTLGTKRMDQMIDGIDPITRKRYMHHYNFPPFSTGEAGFMRGPKRREIGHGALAERALMPVVPSEDEWPYTLRLVSDVMSSNGSTSMASVCSSTLSLMDAGVPIKSPVAGIAMGLVYAEGKYTTLTDILGAEDAFGDMDFKVAGTSEFITALQLDTKIEGIPADVLAAALDQAKDARMQILAVMTEAIPEPRDDVRDVAPKIISFEIPLDKIGEVIGPKGKVINAIQQETGAEVIVDDDGVMGTVSVAGTDRDAVYEAERQINLILDPPTADVGGVYNGKVVNITNFGAFVNILPGRDGLLHISKIGRGKRIKRVEDVLELGQEIEVRVEDIDPNGKVSLVLTDEAEPNNAPSEREEEKPSNKEKNEPTDATNDRQASFEEEFEESLAEELGELGPEAIGGNRQNNRNRRNKGRGGRGK